MSENSDKSITIANIDGRYAILAGILAAIITGIFTVIAALISRESQSTPVLIASATPSKTVTVTPFEVSTATTEIQLTSTETETFATREPTIVEIPVSVTPEPTVVTIASSTPQLISSATPSPTEVIQPSKTPTVEASSSESIQSTIVETNSFEIENPILGNRYWGPGNGDHTDIVAGEQDDIENVRLRVTQVDLQTFQGQLSWESDGPIRSGTVYIDGKFFDDFDSVDSTLPWNLLNSANDESAQLWLFWTIEDGTNSKQGIAIVNSLGDITGLIFDNVSKASIWTFSA
ncbi:MAG: hypothetical protein CL607_23460 [Anaerolineaceae bacterium]|nr:hypothetical protein [Anaerolineaceae bacterium]